MAWGFKLFMPAVAISAAQDLFFVQPSATNIVRITSFSLAQYSSSSPLMERVRMRRIPANITAPTGGTTITTLAWPMNTNGPALKSTVIRNATGKATSSGTILEGELSPFSIVPGLNRVDIPEEFSVIHPGEAWVLDFPSLINSGLNWVGEVNIQEE